MSKRHLELAVGHSDQDATRDLEDDEEEPPLKLRRLSDPQTPLPLNRSLPGTPWTGTPYPPRPSDSPSNPFGRKRTQRMTHSLPPPTSFSKHLPLRFQFVRPELSPRLGGVYRVVQVPLNYTFVQLRCLISFLFGAGYGNEKDDRHMFEVQKKVSIYSQTYKPGQIKTGFTTVKLSTARDPCRYRPDIEEDSLFGDDDESQPDCEPEACAEEADEGDGWTWQAEEEYSLGHVWPKGGDLARAIIYHHNPATAVYITMNTLPLPRRAGVSNTPYVFQARGRVRLLPPSLPILPRPIFSIPVHKLYVPSKAVSPGLNESAEDSDNDEYGDASSCGLFQENSDAADADGDIDEDGVAEEVEEEESEDYNVTISPSRYNSSNAFANYLRMVSQHNHSWKFSQSDTSDSDDDDVFGSTPGLVHCPSSSPISSSFASSPASVGSLFSREPYEASVLSSLSKSAPTPAPSHPLWQRLRLERVQKRMDRLKKEQWLCSKDESDTEEVDQLTEEKAGNRSKDEEGVAEVYEGRHPFEDVDL